MFELIKAIIRRNKQKRLMNSLTVLRQHPKTMGTSIKGK